MNDAALVDGLRRHDPAAVKHLTDCFLPSFWRFVYVRVKGDRHLAEDIVSESVLALIRAVSDPELEIGNPVAWLRTVAAHKVADHFRARTAIVPGTQATLFSKTRRQMISSASAETATKANCSGKIPFNAGKARALA